MVYNKEFTQQSRASVTVVIIMTFNIRKLSEIKRKKNLIWTYYYMQSKILIKYLALEYHKHRYKIKFCALEKIETTMSILAWNFTDAWLLGNFSKPYDKF